MRMETKENVLQQYLPRENGATIPAAAMAAVIVLMKIAGVGWLAAIVVALVLPLAFVMVLAIAMAILELFDGGSSGRAYRVLEASFSWTTKAIGHNIIGYVLVHEPMDDARIISRANLRPCKYVAGTLVIPLCGIGRSKVRRVEWNSANGLAGWTSRVTGGDNVPTAITFYNAAKGDKHFDDPAAAIEFVKKGCRA